MTIESARFAYKGKARSDDESAVSRSKILDADRRETENTKFWMRTEERLKTPFRRCKLF